MTSVPAALPSARPVDQPDNVAPDYKTQASALLYGYGKSQPAGQRRGLSADVLLSLTVVVRLDRTTQYSRGRRYFTPHDCRGVLGPPLSRRTTSVVLRQRAPKTKSRRCRRLSFSIRHIYWRTIRSENRFPLFGITRARSERGFERRFLLRNRALDRRLHLLEGTDFDLTHAFA